MNEIRTHIVCIVDRSGSMQPIAGDAMGGYNSFLENQKSLPGEAVVSTVLFDHEYQRLCHATPLTDAPKLDHGNYVPRGSTALLDAIGRGIEDVLQAGQRPGAPHEHVIMAILTDGFENASTDYTHESVAKRIEEMRTTRGWEFVYLGANQDAIAVASRMNIPASASVNFDATSEGTAAAFREMDERVMYSRRSNDPAAYGKGKKK